MNDINSWGISKQYLAAHYYLSEERPISISEAQRAQLGALHLHVSYGPYDGSLDIPDLQNCTAAERKKRSAEWQKLNSISRTTAMKKFIDLISSLFPNWRRFRKLYSDFEQEWVNMPESTPPHKAATPKPILEKKAKRKALSELRETTPDAFKRIVEMKKLRNKSRRNCVQRKATPEVLFAKQPEKIIETSGLPQIVKSFKQYEQQDRYYIKDFLEDMQSYRGGNIRNTSATRLPKTEFKPQAPEVRYREAEKNFGREMEDYRKALLMKELNRVSDRTKSYSFDEKKIIPNLLGKLHDMKNVIEAYNVN